MDHLIDQEILGSRIVLRDKYKTDGALGKRKAKLVAQGFSLKERNLFQRGILSCGRPSSIRLAIVLAARYKMIDITFGYFNDELEEIVYMEPPKNRFSSKITTKAKECWKT